MVLYGAVRLFLGPEIPIDIPHNLHLLQGKNVFIINTSNIIKQSSSSSSSIIINDQAKHAK
jgi:hypothetical protein